MISDPRGIELTGATKRQASIFEDVTKAYLDYRLSAYPTLKELCENAPEFGMAHLFKGFLLSYLTQSEPEAMGLIAKNLDGVQAPGIRGSHEPAIGF